MKMMKYFLIALFTFLMVTVSYGDAPSNSYVDSWPLWQADTAIDTNGAFDTLAATDSTTILTNFNPRFGWNYYLQHDALTGTGSDSVAMEVRVDLKDNNGNVYQYYAVDSLTSSAGETVLLPFGSKMFGDKCDVKLRTYTGSGSQIIINRLRLWKARPIFTEKKQIK